MDALLKSELAKQLHSAEDSHEALLELIGTAERYKLPRSRYADPGYETEPTILDDLVRLEGVLSDYIDAVKAAQRKV